MIEKHFFRTRRQHLTNILIVIVLSLSLFIFALYFTYSEKRVSMKLLESRLEVDQAHQRTILYQTELYPAVVAASALFQEAEWSAVPAGEGSRIDKLSQFRKRLSGFQYGNSIAGVDYFDAETGILHLYNSGRPERQHIPNHDRWVHDVLMKSSAAHIDIFYTPENGKIYFYFRSRLLSEGEAFLGFYGIRFSYDWVMEDLKSSLLENQLLYLVNRNGQIVCEPGKDAEMFRDRKEVFFLSQQNPRQYLGTMNQHIGIVDDFQFEIEESQSSSIAYSGLMNTYLIVHEDLSPLFQSYGQDNLWIIILLGLTILGVNLFNIFSYQRIILQKNRQLSQLLEEKDMFLSVMTHNVNNTISVISNDLRSALHEQREIGYRRKMILLSWIDTSKHLISNIIYFLRSSHTTLKLPGNEHVDIEELLHILVLRNREKTELKDQTIILELKKPSIQVRTNRNLIMEALENLVDNAIKYSPPQCRIEIALEDTARDHAVVSITDRGPGFSPRDKEKMYKPFTKLSAKPTGGEQSTGLGLYVARSIIDRLGGSLDVRDNDGTGSTFLLTLPSNLDNLIIDNE